MRRVRSRKVERAMLAMSAAENVAQRRDLP